VDKHTLGAQHGEHYVQSSPIISISLAISILLTISISIHIAVKQNKKFSKRENAANNSLLLPIHGDIAY
jgi:hypothetical protein